MERYWPMPVHSVYFSRRGLTTKGLVAATALLCAPLWAQAQTPPPAQRQQELVRMVRQDCGSCHGLHLTGGLGPALTPEALSDKPLDSMVSTIYRGRPGTPMAPWSAMLSEGDALWIAQQLFAGFPEQPTTPPSAIAKEHRP